MKVTAELEPKPGPVSLCLHSKRSSLGNRDLLIRWHIRLKRTVYRKTIYLCQNTICSCLCLPLCQGQWQKAKVRVLPSLSPSFSYQTLEDPDPVVGTGTQSWIRTHWLCLGGTQSNQEVQLPGNEALPAAITGRWASGNREVRERGNASITQQCTLIITLIIH